ncbi:nicotinamide-nucleotide amidohydrolase family protein [Nocardioides sp. InS609-2]|uniref:CinA family protein n=1 Tax=Nocardioides sp. InS609-2 TaxID=2760705 RepID=UPI0020BE077F|nr:nicotinamide-nucleotide amidohydrolase family protein [Nocardioides sp. InS609-2]
MSEAVTVLDLLRSRRQTLAVAESLTGGRLAAAVTAVPGASAVFLGGVVAYATSLKTAVVGVPDDLVAEYGVVSAECARAMAVGVRDLTGASYALSTTGVAGPDSQEGHPVGTVFVGLAGPGEARVAALSLTGDRLAVADATVRAALGALIEYLDAVER